MLPVDIGSEHAIVPLDGRVSVGEDVVEPGWIALLPAGHDEVPVATEGPARFLLLGGRPLEERIAMWWNFVARDQQELTAAYRDWQDRNTDRFADVPSSLTRIDAPRPPWLGRTTRDEA
ncbi:MAG: pirin-like C-terminal cupin domain-containing protein [Nitriliruptor sp.]